MVILFTITGSKQCYDEPINLTQKVREALRKGDSKNEKASENAESDHQTNTNAKETDDESVKKRDKV